MLFFNQREDVGRIMIKWFAFGKHINQNSVSRKIGLIRDISPRDMSYIHPEYHIPNQAE